MTKKNISNDILFIYLFYFIYFNCQTYLEEKLKATKVIKLLRYQWKIPVIVYSETHQPSLLSLCEKISNAMKVLQLTFQVMSLRCVFPLRKVLFVDLWLVSNLSDCLCLLFDFDVILSLCS